ncbi:tyrosine--tRNA ligase [bacterium]|nr:tyrosine--tRNA ligase [bacterium]
MKCMQQQDVIEKVLTHNVERIYPTADALREVLKSGKRLRLYVGVDPTSPHLHIGHAMQFKKLREFQDLGHEVILLIGSFTAMIGDPTDKSATRKQLTAEEVMANAKTYKEQAAKIIRFDGENPAKLMFNDEWLAKLSFKDVLELTSQFTVQQMMERDMFEKRWNEEKPIGLHEFMYPLMQGFDSVAMDVDIEIGGNDQTFNMLAGRTLMKAGVLGHKPKEKFVVAVKLLTNEEGKKMSKSEGGMIAIDDAPEDMFGKIMSMGDSMIVPYFAHVLDASEEILSNSKARLEQGENPRNIKMELAEEVVRMYHGQDAAQKAREHFVNVFQKHVLPEEMDEVKVEDGMSIVDILVNTKLATSKTNARQLIEQGGVKLGDNVVSDVAATVSTAMLPLVLQKGKRGFVKLVKESV